MKISIIFIVFSATQFITPAAYCQDNNLCVGNYWTEGKAKVMMAKFQEQWNDLNDAKNKIPDGALQGDEAVMNYLNIH